MSASSSPQALVPLGGIIPFYASGSIPSGWQLCDGSAIDPQAPITQLLNITTTPDLSGLVLVGAGTAASGTTYTARQTGGAETVTLTQQQIPGHTHGYKQTTITTGSDVGKSGSSAGAVVTENSDTDETTGSSGGGAAHTNMQPYFVIAFIMYIG